MYHGIAGEAEVPSRWRIPLRTFREHMQLLRSAGFYSLRIGELSCPRAPGGVLLTFDDGYRDNLDAADCMLSLGFTGAWFVLSGRL